MGTPIPQTNKTQNSLNAKHLLRHMVAPVCLAILLLIAIVPMHVSAAVTISSFTATAKEPHIEIDWTTATEINNAGFNLFRSTSQNGTYTQIAGLIPAKNPGSVLGASYSHTDDTVAAGQTYFYKLESVESSGSTQQFGPVSASVAAPATATPLPTSTPPPPTAVPTETSVPTSTPIPPATATPLPTPTMTPLAAQAAKVSRTSSSPTPESGITLENLESPTPGLTLVALGIKDTPVPEMDSAQTVTNTPALESTHTRSYYLLRLIDATLFLTAGSLIFASLVLGAVSVYLFLRAYLR